ncbi:MAG: PqqD family protein [Acidobacteria bacterium]|nr:PqqD family protein [Acidobacteriota bacterium]
MKTLPRSRTENIIQRQIDDEILLYDLESNKAFSLNKTASTVYRYCDGRSKMEEVVKKEDLKFETIMLALHHLNQENLIESSAEFESGFEGLSRRQIVKTMGIGSIAALPLISAVVAPLAINAQSVSLLATGAACTNPVECQSSVCFAVLVPGPPQTFPGTPPTVFPNVIPGNPPIVFPGSGPITIPGIPTPGPTQCI